MTARTLTLKLGFYDWIAVERLARRNSQTPEEFVETMIETAVEKESATIHDQMTRHGNPNLKGISCR